MMINASCTRPVSPIWDVPASARLAALFDRAAHLSQFQRTYPCWEPTPLRSGGEG